MKFGLSVIIALIILSVLPAFADELHNDSSAELSRTAVVMDEEAGTISFIIEGREVMRLEADGLHVRDNIYYGGIIVDVGREAFDNQIVEGADVQ